MTMRGSLTCSFPVSSYSTIIYHLLNTVTPFSEHKQAMLFELQNDMYETYFLKAVKEIAFLRQEKGQKLIFCFIEYLSSISQNIFGWSVIVSGIAICNLAVYSHQVILKPWVR